MTSRIGSRLPRTRERSWPAHRATSSGRHPLLTAERWRRLSPCLQDDRRIAEAALRALHSGRAANETVRAALRAWMLDGRWVDFWVGYVALLTPRERSRWRRALSRPAEAKERAWRLVSARLLS